MHVRRCGSSHLFERPVDVSFVILMIAGAVDHWLFEGFVCPQNAFGLYADVAGQHDKISLDVGRIERLELDVKVGVDKYFHFYWSLRVALLSVRLAQDFACLATGQFRLMHILRKPYETAAHEPDCAFVVKGNDYRHLLVTTQIPHIVAFAGNVHVASHRLCCSTAIAPHAPR